MRFAEYDQHDGLGLAALVASGQVTPAELLEEAIDRAERVNPVLNAIVVPMFDEARERARAGLPAGPFHGVPFLMKDLGTAVAGVPLRNGSRLCRDVVPSHDAELTRRYRRAGVSLFGKTNTPEFGILPATEPVLHGPTHNPWRLGCSPGGSSGGAAASVAAGIAPMAHGGDGGGSIRIPASCCGLFGLKPTRGRQPCGPDFTEIFFGYATEHVLTRSVRDSAAMLDATAGPEATSPYHAPRAPGSFLAAAGASPPRLRVAFTADPLLPAHGVDPACRAAVLSAARLLESLGHEVEEARPSFDAPAFARDFFLSFAAGTAAELDRAGALRGRPVTHEDVETETYLLAMIGRGLDAAAFVLARRRLQDASRDILRFFESHDVLLTPTLARPPLRHGALLARGLEARLHRLVAAASLRSVLRIRPLVDRVVSRAYDFSPFTPLFNVTGQPSASLPLSWSDGLPIGVMITAGFGEDALLLQLAAQLEQARPWRDRRPPVWSGR